MTPFQLPSEHGAECAAERVGDGIHPPDPHPPFHPLFRNDFNGITPVLGGKVTPPLRCRRGHNTRSVCVSLLI